MYSVYMYGYVWQKRGLNKEIEFRKKVMPYIGIELTPYGVSV